MPRDYYHFYVVRPGDSVSSIFTKLHGLSTHEIGSYLRPIAANKPHIDNLDRIRPGQWLDVRLQCSSRDYQLHKVSDMNELERLFQTLTPPQKEFLTEYPHVVSTMLDLVTDAALNTADSAGIELSKFTSIATEKWKGSYVHHCSSKSEQYSVPGY